MLPIHAAANSERTYLTDRKPQPNNLRLQLQQSSRRPTNPQPRDGMGSPRDPSQRAMSRPHLDADGAEEFRGDAEPGARVEQQQYAGEDFDTGGI